MIAVLGMFNPILLGITDNNHYVIQEASKSLPEDPYDEEFLRETSVIIQKTFYVYHLSSMIVQLILFLETWHRS